MRILIYDDNVDDVEKLRKCLDVFLQSRIDDYEIAICRNTEELYRIANKYDVIFLEVIIGDESGIDMGIKLREQGIDCHILIISAYEDYVFEAFWLRADRYIIKPITQNKFNFNFSGIFDEYLRKHLGFYDTKISNNKILFHNIIYIESLNHKTIIYFTKNKKMETSYPLKYWIEKLDNNIFVQPHKSFIVNMNYVYEVYINEVKLITGMFVPISRYYRQELSKKHKEFILNNM